MRNWTAPEVVELSVSMTQHGDAPLFPLDGAYTDNGLPYGADVKKES